MQFTRPIFILGSGRSGTLQMTKLLDLICSVEVHHEYLFESILKTAVLYRMGVKGKEDVKRLLNSTHSPAVYYSEATYWVDSSNALPWIVEPLFELFPQAHFIHLLRDGRKVVSSFYNKFSEVMYNDRDLNIVRDWLSNPLKCVEPSSEKKYWRPFPIYDEPFSAEFVDFDRFQRLCYYWQDCNLGIKNTLKHIPKNQQTVLRLEDLVSQPPELERFLKIFDVAYEERFMDILKRPVNVHIPKNFLLTDVQNTQFDAIAGNAMRVFGYDGREEYQVEYHRQV